MNRVTDDASRRPALTDLTFHILIALGNGPAHGYAIGKDVEEQSGGRLDPSSRSVADGRLRPRLGDYIRWFERRGSESFTRNGPEWFGYTAG